MERNNPKRTYGVSVHLKLTGTGGHSSVPHKSHNPIIAGFELINLLNSKLWYAFDSYDNVFFYPLSFQAGVKENIIPDSAKIIYYGEYVNEEQYEKFAEILQTVLKGIHMVHQVECEILLEEKRRL